MLRSGRFKLTLLFTAWLSGSMACALLSCTPQEKAPAPRRTEPWRSGETVEGSKSPAKRLRFALAPGGKLDITLPTRRSVPSGTLTGLSGHLIVNPDQLQFVEGRINVDLLQLRMDDSLRVHSNTKSKSPLDPELEQRLNSETWSVQALNWLGLGRRAKYSEVTSRATFSIESARDLSHPRAAAGGIFKTDSSVSHHKNVRLVNATVLGTLSIGTTSVSRSIPVRILFYYETEVTRHSEPSEIRVELHGPFSVPLSEYDIRPRDQEGHEQSEMSPIVGYLVGESARISGSLRFSKVAF